MSDVWLADQVRAALNDFTAQLRSGVDGAIRVPNLDWNVADLAGHVACLPSLYRRQHAAGPDFELPDDFAAFSDAARAHIAESDPVALAALMASEIGDFIAEIDDGAEVRWLYGRRTTAANICAGLLSELTIHGRDLAAVTGTAKPEFDRRQANAVADAMMIITPVFVDPDKVRRTPEGTYLISFRGGNDYTWVLGDGGLEITRGRPRRPDARLNADPATFVLSSMGRLSDIRAGLTGGLVAYGRKPWRFVALGDLAIDGI